MNIGLIGIGSIGTFLIEQLNKEKRIDDYHVTAIFDERSKPNAKLDELSEKYNIIVYKDLSTFLASSVDLVVECANTEAVQKYAPEVVSEKDLLLISVGALVDPILYDTLKQSAQQFKRKIYLPSGAIGGLDVLRAASELNGLSSVSLTTRKPSQALSVEIEDEEKTVFEGTAEKAIAQFPKNANIAIIISLAGLGIKETSVKIVADPDITKNIHQLKATGDFGKLDVTLENNPSPNNPKTSFLTALSVLSTLRSLTEAIVIK